MLKRHRSKIEFSSVAKTESGQMLVRNRALFSREQVGRESHVFHKDPVH